MNRKIEKNIYKFTSWDNVQISKIPSIVKDTKKSDYEKIKKIPKKERTFENTFFALQNSGMDEDYNILLLHILMNLSPKEEIRKSALKAEEEYEKRAIDLFYDQGIYKALLEYIELNYKKEKSKLNKSEIKYIEDTILTYKNSGFELDKTKQKNFKDISKKIATQSSRFRFNINASQEYILCTREELDGLPDNFISSLKRESKTEKFIVSTRSSEYGIFMKLATNEEKRKELAILSLQKGGKKNIDILTDLIKLRHQAANILGYNNHINRTLSQRMAKNEKTAVAFVESIFKKIKTKSKKEKELIDNLKSDNVGKKTKAEFYDVAFYSNKLYEKEASINVEEIKRYFETENTVREMLNLYEDLFNLSFSYTKEIPVWDKSVTVIKVCDKKNKEQLGYIYMDLYPRDGKYGHAMVTHATNGFSRIWRSDDYTMPICALVCNFSTPSKKNPSLLSLSEVETLFHEFGHAIHTVLTKVELESQSGTNVTWDFVEAPSQMLENFIYNKHNLKNISKNIQTGKSLDNKTIDKIILNKNFMIATHISRQLMFCKFDFSIHGSKRPKDIVKTYNDLYFNITGNKLPKETYFPAGFGHMDGYDAAYYSYMWSLVYAQDIYSKFEKAKNKKELKKIGLEYREKVLEVGSSRDELKSVIDFLGRKPNIKAFLTSQSI